MSQGRIFRICRGFLPLLAAGALGACGSDSGAFGAPFSASPTDAGAAQSQDSAGKSGGSGSGGSGGKAASGTGGSGGRAQGQATDSDEDAGQKEESAGAGGSASHAGSGGSGSGGSGGSASHAGSGGTAGASGSGSAAVSFGDIFTGTIQLGCSCHNGGAGGLDLGTRAAAYKNLVSVASSSCSDAQRVVPGNPEASVLFHAINHSALGSCKVPNMPQGGSKLTQAQLDQVQAWIAAGAPDN